MGARVLLARRNLLAERRRFTMSLLGVGAAIALILLLQGLWSGTRLQISAYQDNVGGAVRGPAWDQELLAPTTRWCPKRWGRASRTSKASNERLPS